MKLLNHSFILRYSNPPFSDLLEMLFLFPPLGNLACLAQLPVFVKENSFICIVGFPLAVCNDDKAFLNSKLYNLQFHERFFGNLKVLTILSPLWCTPGIFVSFAGQACTREFVIRWSSLIRHTLLIIIVPYRHSIGKCSGFFLP